MEVSSEDESVGSLNLDLDVSRSVYQEDVELLLPELTRSYEDIQGNFMFYDLNCETVMLVLINPCTLHFYGSVSVQSLAGQAEILGYVLDVSKPPVQVYSCEGASALYVSTLDPVKQTVDVDISVISDLGVCFMEATKISNLVKDGGCVLLLKEVERQRYTRAKGGRAERRLGLNLDTPRRRIKNKVIIPPEIILDFKSGITVLCGGQGVGKSTSLRFLANRTLNSVKKLLYIDLDIGQPEFTLHESVSAILLDGPVIGPSYTHFRKPVISYNVGNIDASRCVDTYLSAVELLINRCRTEYSHIPWLVNTMGFSRGVGVYLTCSCLALIGPSLVIQIYGDKNQNFPSDLMSGYVESVAERPTARYGFIKVIKEHKRVKDNNYSFTHTNKQIRWISTENYFSNHLRPCYPLTIPQEFVQVLNVIDRSVIPVDRYTDLVSKLIILSSSDSLQEPLEVLDYGVILSYVENDKVFLIMTPMEQDHHIIDIQSILVGSLQVPSRLNKAVGPDTSGPLPYCQISQTGKTAPTVKPLKRTYRFLFDPSYRSKVNTDSNLPPVS